MTKAVGVLFEHGADIHVRQPEGRSLVQVAPELGFGEIARLLEERGGVSVGGRKPGGTVRDN
jgi:hypothetical protein